MINKKNKKRVLIAISLFIMVFLLSNNYYNNTNYYNNIDNNVKNGQYLKSDVFISSDVIFDNKESLNQPIGIRENPVTSEYVVADYGNNCLYIFSHNGKYIKKVGREGQGPGDLLRPRYLFIDIYGNIYVYEGGNLRISIFSKEGKFINSFRININNQLCRFYVSENKEIIFSMPQRGYYITIYDIKGNIIKEIGKLVIINKDEIINQSLSLGIPIKTSDDNYYIFINGLGIINKYNEKGEKINAYSYPEAINGYLNYDFSESKLSKLKYASVPVLGADIILRNNLIYIFDYYIIKKLNMEMKLLDTFQIDPKTKLYNDPEALSMYVFFELNDSVNNIEFFLPALNSSEILKYYNK